MTSWTAERSRLLADARARQRTLNDSVEQVLLAAAREQIGREPACTTCRGPYHCCRMLVAVTVLDALPIAERLTALGDSSAVDRLRKQADAQRECSHPATWFNRNEPCAFLAAGRCSIYDVRPLPCRIHHAYSDPFYCDCHDPDHLVSIASGLGASIEVLHAAFHFERDVLDLHRAIPYLDILPAAVLTVIQAIQSTSQHRFQRVLGEAQTIEKDEAGRLRPLGMQEQTP